MHTLKHTHTHTHTRMHTHTHTHTHTYFSGSQVLKTWDLRTEEGYLFTSLSLFLFPCLGSCVLGVLGRPFTITLITDGGGAPPNPSLSPYYLILLHSKNILHPIRVQRRTKWDKMTPSHGVQRGGRSQQPSLHSGPVLIRNK